MGKCKDCGLHEVEQRRVTKYNEISYKSQKYHVTPGYSGIRVEVIEYEDKIELYHKERLLILTTFQSHKNIQKHTAYNIIEELRREKEFIYYITKV